MANEIKCSACGKVYNGTSGYCRYCGEPINIKEAQNDSVLEGIDIENWKQFIGDNHQKILPIFKKHQGKKFFVDFITPAFFFPVQWLLYRKMYKEAVFTEIFSWLLVFCVLLLAKVEIALTTVFMLPLLLLCKIILALPCPMFYRNYCKKELSKEEPNYKKGGVSWMAAVVFSYIIEIAVYYGLILLAAIVAVASI